MADFDLTQTDAQVQNILNDGQSAMGAGAQTTLTTEYIMLKDINGVYHKILKSSFTEAIRDVLAGLLVNNDKGTTISQIAAIASGDFGSVTPANLASVLGALGNSIYITTADLNTIGKGIYVCHGGGTITNSPYASNNVYGLLICLYGNGGGFPILQIFVDPRSKNDIYVRSKWFNQAWNSWQKVSLTAVDS